tara:strand:+ start:1227 stop:1820 length:594 start_codon:yes stop_codon:yes gene_type:complete
MTDNNSMAKAAMEMAADVLVGDLQEEAKQKINRPAAYTSFFVKVIGYIDQLKIIPPDFKSLRTVMVGVNKKTQSETEEEIKRHVPKTQTSITPKDLEHWVQTSKKGDQIVYYTGTTFDKKMMNEANVFNRARALAMDYDEVIKKKKSYQYRGHTKGEWGCNYTGIVDLLQKKVTNIQKDKEGNIISYPIYNYIMVKR